MAQSVAVVRNTLSATASGTTDFTKSGFGTPSAAIIVICEANTSANPADHAVVSVGFWDGTDQRVCAASSADNADTAVENRRSDDDIGGIAGSALNTDYTVSAVTDGIRLTLSVDNTGAERYCTVLLLAGVSAKTLTFTPNATQNATQESASLGFAPELVLFTCVGNTTADTGVATQSILTFGFARSDGQHRMFGFGGQNGAGVTNNTLLYSESRCAAQVFDGSLSWGLEVTTFGADTFTATTRDGGSGSDVCFALALGGDDLSFDSGTLTTPASTGNDVVSTTIAPDAVLAVLTTSDDTTIQTTTEADGFCIGLADGDGQFAHNFTTGDALDTSNAQSAASAAAILDLDEESSGFAAVADATLGSLNASDFTLNYSAVPGTARKGFWVAFGAAGGGGGTILPLLNHYMMG